MIKTTAKIKIWIKISVSQSESFHESWKICMDEILPQYL